MWNMKWLSAFFCIVNIRGSMIVGNYRKQKPILRNGNHRDYCVNRGEFMCGNFSSALLVPETRSPLDLSNSYWHEVPSPYTESSDESYGETTTHVHEPFFEENSTQINVTTQLGSDVYLHCRVNDLREKMVSEATLFCVEHSRQREVILKSENEKSFTETCHQQRKKLEPKLLTHFLLNTVKSL